MQFKKFFIIQDLYQHISINLWNLQVFGLFTYSEKLIDWGQANPLHFTRVLIPSKANFLVLAI